MEGTLLFPSVLGTSLSCGIQIQKSFSAGDERCMTYAYVSAFSIFATSHVSIFQAKWGEGDPRWVVESRDDGKNVNGW